MNSQNTPKSSHYTFSFTKKNLSLPILVKAREYVMYKITIVTHYYTHIPIRIYMCNIHFFSKQQNEKLFKSRAQNSRSSKTQKLVSIIFFYK